MIPLVLKHVAYRMIGMQYYCLATALWKLSRGYEKSYENFLGLLPPGGLLLDIGANIGVTVAFASRKRPDLKVIAFEPVPSNLLAARRLCRTLRISDVDFQQVALGDSIGTVEMVMPLVSKTPAPGQSYLLHDEFDYASIPVLSEGGSKFKVPLTMIDSLGLPKVAGIKLDVENFEGHVLRGGVQLLKRDHPIIYCELWDTPNRSSVMNLLSELGYISEKQDTKEDFLFQ
ncbi:MAG: FkbM family methyltransferase [Terracidiphilus sp.]